MSSVVESEKKEVEEKQSKKKRHNWHEEKFDIGDGKKATAYEISEISKMPYNSIINKINNGIRGKDLVTNLRFATGKRGKKYIVDGKEYTMSELSNKFGILKTTLYKRYEAGYRNKDLIAKRLSNKKKKDNSNIEK